MEMAEKLAIQSKFDRNFEKSVRSDNIKKHQYREKFFKVEQLNTIYEKSNFLIVMDIWNQPRVDQDFAMQQKFNKNHVKDVNTIYSA